MLSSSESAELADWIKLENLGAWLEIVASMIRYDFLSDEREVVVRAAQGTDAEAGRWYEYDLHGDALVHFALGQDDGTNVLQVRIVCPNELLAQIGTATSIAQHYRLER